ncbi:isochorismatase family protein [Fervidobacterium nodosum]|uniref:Isochorismatase hydrolase n=1 Tax=Fervidobacterium nodosum (strain ATCC 35602 / DSM 5306 / Rt17-B1) TaxID=381764 RepID=A7HKB2_FERNB|nr:isochorismatase family protein [Fervidobacterium nodosum]ABS60345.1 isochorismatase hydrolase [Fervidobacterium nodosum Rt17-B1]
MFFIEKEKHKFSLSNPALLVIDVQNYFFDKTSPAYLRGSERVLENIKEITNSVMGKIPIIGTLHIGGSNPLKKWWGNIVEVEWTKLMVEDYKFNHIIKKDTYDAFYKTSLEEILNFLKVDQLIITGVMTHLCCETTARSAFVRGYEVIMVEDCLWDKDEWYHYASLKNLAHGFAVISNKEEILKNF